jgi:hypothetical protein
MSLNELKPDIIAGQLLARLNDSLVFRNVANTNYQGEITSQGQSVRITEIGPVTINSYTMGTTSDLTIEQLDVAAKTLRIDQASSFAFTIDDADNAQAKAKVLNDGITQGAWGLANDIDEYIAALYSEAGLVAGGTASTGVDITSTNLLKYFSIAAQKLDEENTPQLGRWAAIPPWMHHKAVLAGIVHDTDNTEKLMSGSVGRIYGFDLYPTNNISAISSTDRYPCLLGYRGSISMAVQVLNSEIVRPSKQFVTLAKGLVVYGAKVVRPNNLCVLYADYTDEAS